MDFWHRYGDSLMGVAFLLGVVIVTPFVVRMFRREVRRSARHVVANAQVALVLTDVKPKRTGSYIAAFTELAQQLTSRPLDEWLMDERHYVCLRIVQSPVEPEVFCVERMSALAYTEARPNEYLGAYILLVDVSSGTVRYWHSVVRVDMPSEALGIALGKMAASAADRYLTGDSVRCVAAELRSSPN